MSVDMEDELWQSYLDCSVLRPWTAEAVSAYLVFAFATLRDCRMDSPLHYAKVFWPSYLYTHEDREGWFPSERERDHRIMRRRWSPRQVSFMERIIYWPIAYLSVPAMYPPRPQVVGLYAACKAYSWPFRKAYRARGWERDTVYRRIASGHEAIASNLNSCG